MGNLVGRVEKLEKVKGPVRNSEVTVILLVSPDDLEPTPEETAALDDYAKKVEAEPLSEGQLIKLVIWNKEKAQEFISVGR